MLTWYLFRLFHVPCTEPVGVWNRLIFSQYGRRNLAILKYRDTSRIKTYLIKASANIALMATMTPRMASATVSTVSAKHDDVIKWKHFPRYWPFVWGIHRSPVNSPHKGQWRGALMFTLICARINGWVNNREAGDLRRYRTHYDVIVMEKSNCRVHWNPHKATTEPGGLSTNVLFHDSRNKE